MTAKLPRLGLAALLLAAGYSGPSLATLAENLTVSPEALSMGNAVTADPPGIFSVHYNPAGLTQFSAGTWNHLSFLLPPSITSEGSFTAPPDYPGVFGYKDDPVIGTTSKVTSVTAYVPTLGKQRIDNKFLPLPLGGLVYRPEGSRYVFANAAYAYVVAGMGKDPDDVAGSYSATDTIIQRIVLLSPSIAADVTDTLSVGMSVGVNYSAFLIDQSVRANNEMLGLARFVSEEICPTLTDAGGLPFIPPRCMGDKPLNPFGKLATIKMTATDPIGLSFNMGLLWKPNDSFALGLAYQAPYKANFRGEFEFEYGEELIETIDALTEDALVRLILEILGMPLSVPKSDTGDVRLDLEFPAHVAIGSMFRFSDRWQLNVDWHWTDWDKWNTLSLVTNRQTVMNQLGRYVGIAGPRNLNMNLGLETQPNFAMGLKYYYSSRLNFRTGVEYRRSSLPPNKLSYQLPFGNTWLFGAGATYSLSEAFGVDFSLAHFVSKVNIPAGTSDNANSTGIDNVLSPYAGLDVKFKTQGLLAAISLHSRF